MKKLCALIMVLTGFFPFLQSCPDCVGKVTEQSPPFFTDECYQDMRTESIESAAMGQKDTVSLLVTIDKGEQ